MKQIIVILTILILIVGCNKTEKKGEASYAAVKASKVAAEEAQKEEGK